MSGVVRMRGVSKVFANGVVALDGVDLAVAAGELVGVVGPSGSGKSTLLNVMGTLDRPSSGEVLVDGRDVAGMSDRELSTLRADRIGFVFQRFHLTAGKTALDSVADGLLYSGVRRSERLRRAGEVLGRVGLADRIAHRPHELSGGERQRVAIARAVVGEPALLLADEPTGNLDSVAGTKVLDVLRGLHVGGTAVVVITHDLDIAARLPRQVHLRDGRVAG